MTKNKLKETKPVIDDDERDDAENFLHYNRDYARTKNPLLPRVSILEKCEKPGCTCGAKEWVWHYRGGL